MFENHDVDDENVVPNEELDAHDDVLLEEEESGFKDKLKILREKLLCSEKEKQKCQDDLQRARADFLNSKRRLDEQLARDRERAVDKILIELLTLADSFDIAVSDKDWASLDTKWRLGIEAIQAKLSSILKSNHITAIDPLGEQFKPQEHEAVSNTEVENEEDIEKIITVLQKGYRRGDDVIRPARVIVGIK